jgi:hypothetical protein
MAEHHSWMYSAWDKGGNYKDEWMDYALAPDVMYVTAKGVVWSDFWGSFLSSFFKALSLTHLTLLLLDFEIVEMIPLANQIQAGPCEECV